MLQSRPRYYYGRGEISSLAFCRAIITALNTEKNMVLVQEIIDNYELNLYEFSWGEYSVDIDFYYNCQEDVHYCTITIREFDDYEW